MDEEAFNLSIRKFLKVVGIGSQREIERAVAQAIADGKHHRHRAFSRARDARRRGPRHRRLVRRRDQAAMTDVGVAGTLTEGARTQR